MPEGLKREHRIDSTDAARPQAQIGDEPYAYAQGLKPKPRVIVETNYEELNESVPRGKGKPMAQLILKTTTYDDGTTVDTTVGEDNVGYQDFLRGAATIAAGGSGETRLRRPTKKPTNSKTKSKE